MVSEWMGMLEKFVRRMYTQLTYRLQTFPFRCFPRYRVSYNERNVTSPNAEDAYSFEIVRHVPLAAEGDAKPSKRATSKQARNSCVEFRAESLVRARRV